MQLASLIVAWLASFQPIHLPVVADVTSPFVAEGVMDSRGDRLFRAKVLATAARVPAPSPLVIQASVVIGGDPLKATMNDVRCAPAIDGQRGVATPVPQPSAEGEAVERDTARPAFPDLRWFGTFTAGPIPAGRHEFSLECESASPFALRGTASVKVTRDVTSTGR